MCNKKIFDNNNKNIFIAYYKVKGGSSVTNSCGSGCNTYVQTNPCCNGGGISNFAFILVLFILLVICGAAYIF